MSGRRRKLRPGRLKRVEMSVVGGGEVLAADYSDDEAAVMTMLRRAGVASGELRGLHTVKALLDATIEPEPGDMTPRGAERRCHLCKVADRPLTFVPESGVWFCAGEVGAVWCKHRARLRLGVSWADSCAVVLAELPDWYPQGRRAELEERLAAAGPKKGRAA